MNNDTNAGRVIDVVETGVFAISINDGYCEHTYKIKLDDEPSIHKLMKKICKKLKVDMPDSVLRWSILED